MSWTREARRLQGKDNRHEVVELSPSMPGWARIAVSCRRGQDTPDPVGMHLQTSGGFPLRWRMWKTQESSGTSSQDQ